MRERMRGFGAALVLGIAALGCEPPPGVGEEGGACRVGRVACDGDRVCEDGVCMAPEDAPPPTLTAEDFAVSFRLQRRSLVSDGDDNQIVQVDIAAAANPNVKFNGEMLVRTDPLQAARLEPSRLRFEDGASALRVRACDASARECPDRFRLVLARVDQPTETLATSPAVSYSAGTGLCGADGCWSGRLTLIAQVPAIGGMPARTVTVESAFTGAAAMRAEGASEAGEGVSFEATVAQSTGSGALRSFVATYDDTDPRALTLVGTSALVALSRDAGAPEVRVTCVASRSEEMAGGVSLDASGALARGDAVSACSVQVDAAQVTALPAGAPATTLTAQARLEVSATR